MVDRGEVSQPFEAVRADFQTSGRGQMGNSWESEEGKNILMSLYLRPTNIEISRQFVLSMAVSVALVEAIEPLLAPEQREALKVKWPNDIYLGHRKLAGILIENRLMGHDIIDTIVGIGLNVNQTEFLSGAPNPISLAQATGKTYDVPELAQKIVTAIHEHMHLVDLDDDAQVSRTYWARLFRADGGVHTFADANGRFYGIIASVGLDGRLMLKDLEGFKRSYLFKEVEHVIDVDGNDVIPNMPE